jgi:hypothetical protein
VACSIHIWRRYQCTAYLSTPVQCVCSDVIAYTLIEYCRSRLQSWVQITLLCSLQLTSSVKMPYALASVIISMLKLLCVHILCAHRHHHHCHSEDNRLCKATSSSICVATRSDDCSLRREARHLRARLRRATDKCHDMELRHVRHHTYRITTTHIHM